MTLRPGENCVIVMQMKRARYTVKYWTVRFITHCMAGEIGGVRDTSVGCSMMNTETITAVKPIYRERTSTYRVTCKTTLIVLFSLSKMTSPSDSPCLQTQLGMQSGTMMQRRHCTITEYVQR